MKEKLNKKVLAIGIILLFIGTCFAPNICGKSSASEINKESLVTSYVVSDSATVSLHIFDNTGEKQIDVVIPADNANEINNMLEELKHKIIYEPMSDETQTLKNRFVNLLDLYGLIPKDLSKDYLLSLLNPSWVNNNQEMPEDRARDPLLKSLQIRKIGNVVKLQQLPQSSQYGGIGLSGLCTIASGGIGVILPLILLPRPRGVALWSGNFSDTLAAKFLLGRGFNALGEQKGIVLGFVGLGLTFAVPGYSFYGFMGYALFTLILADVVMYF